MKQELKIVAIGLALFVLYLPVAVIVHSGYSPKPRPAGKTVEMITKFGVDEPRYIARSYVFSPAKFPDTSPIRIYENTAPLPSKNIHFTADGLAYVIRLTTSDGSDPRSNGRQYWLVEEKPDEAFCFYCSCQSYRGQFQGGAIEYSPARLVGLDDPQDVIADDRWLHDLERRAGAAKGG